MTDTTREQQLSALSAENESLKAENERKSKLVKGLVKVICGSVIAILALVAGFLLYLNQYDYADIDTTNATGVYAVVDSSGNVIASDLTSDEINQILEVIAANGTNYENASTVED